MIFTETDLRGAFVIDREPHEDLRGAFARTFCAREFAEHGIPFVVAQANASVNLRRGTLRGMHFPAPGHPEAKVVRCVRGSIHDVLVDVRLHSPTHRAWVGCDLTARNGRMLYVPPDLAHGFVTLENDTEVGYLMGAFHEPGAARGVRWDDPAFDIAWPVPVVLTSDVDASWPDYDPEAGSGWPPSAPPR